MTTVIGESVRLKGNLEGDEDLTILGRVEGTIELTKTLNVEPSGIVKADVSVQNAVVSGVVVGNIRAHDSVEITKQGRMVGDIAAPRVILVDGASFRGQIDMGDLESPRRVDSAPRARPAPAPARAPGKPTAVTPPRKGAVAEPSREPAKPTPKEVAHEIEHRPEQRSEPRAEPRAAAPAPAPQKAAMEPPTSKLMPLKKRKVAVKKR